MNERRQRSWSINPERMNPLTPDGEQMLLLSMIKNYPLPDEEVNFAVFGVLPPHMQNFWQVHKPMGVNKCLKAIIQSAFPVFINHYKNCVILENLDALSHEALFHSILEYMQNSVGKGLITKNPTSIRRQLSSAWNENEFLSAEAASNYVPPKITQLQKVMLAYRQGSPQLKMAVELILMKENPVAFAHKHIMKEFVEKILF